MTAAPGRQGQRHTMALLIDGDNAQALLVAEILAETAKYGTITVRRVYGDWTTPQMAGWKKTLHAYAVQPQQQFPHTSGKNFQQAKGIERWQAVPAHLRQERHRQRAHHRRHGPAPFRHRRRLLHRLDRQ